MVTARGRRYELTKYSKGEGDRCNHPALIPGLDASICPTCRMVWPTGLPAETAPPLAVAEVFTGPLSDLPDSPASKQSAALPAMPAPFAEAAAKGADVRIKYAVTLKRPWAWAIAHQRKRIENRSWKCYAKPGDWIAIHAGQGYESDGAEWIAETFGVIVPEPQDHPTGIVAIAQFLGNITTSKNPWYNGSRYGWLFGEVRALIDPVPCPGQRGLWEPSEAVKAKVYTEMQVPF